MGIERLKAINISDEDICWVEEMMGNNLHFDSERVNIIKNMDSIDIQAFPGSGKTTILVAKLAILAKKWTYTHSGICVLSHTNVAREEIENKLGNNTVGKQLLSYPHFIGTLQSFFDTYVAIPWLRSKGYDINLIDTKHVELLRWFKLPYKTRAYLERQNKNESICSYKGDIGKIDWTKNGKTGALILEAIATSQKEGYFTFEEMLLYAKQALNERPEIALSLQRRFPILLIDEAQDTDLLQWELLQAAFNKDEVNSIRQGYGDSNQAIYNSLLEVEASQYFPREGALILSESKRFDYRIAKLANTVAISAAQMNGTNNHVSNRLIKHTIFLFEKDKAECVINEFGQLILDSFLDEELDRYKAEGCHVVGMVHSKKEDTPIEHFPKGIYDYWDLYKSEKATNTTVPKYLIEYFRYGIMDLQATGEKAKQIKWIADGLRRMINKAKKASYIPAHKNVFKTLINALPDESQIDFRKMVNKLSDIDESISETDWISMTSIINDILSLFDISDIQDVEGFAKFTKWIKEEIDQPSQTDDLKKMPPNHYVYRDETTQRTVDLEFGSIHSVKGRTHMATLILETYLRTHNMKAILKFLCNKPPKSIGKNSKRLKCQYVAMTRARFLLCLALPIEFVNEKNQERLREIGWNVKKV